MMLQIAHNVIDSEAAALHAKHYLIIDGDTDELPQLPRL